MRIKKQRCRTEGVVSQAELKAQAQGGYLQNATKTPSKLLDIVYKNLSLEFTTIIYLFMVYACTVQTHMYVCMWHVCAIEYVWKLKDFQESVSLSSMWALRIELRSPGLVSRTFTPRSRLATRASSLLNTLFLCQFSEVRNQINDTVCDIQLFTYSVNTDKFFGVGHAARGFIVCLIK